MSTPESYWIGQELNWDAPAIAVTLIVELPFWLMTSDSVVNIEVENYPFEIIIRDNYYELFGQVILDSRDSCAYIGPKEKIGKQILEVIKKENIPTLWRKCKTVLKIKTLCNEDIFIKKEEHEGVVNHYLTSFFAAHIPVVNKLIEQYRLSTYDYFAYNVSPWDVPIWYISLKGDAIKNVLVRYKDWDDKPMMYEQQEDPKIYNLISSENLQESFNITPSAGEFELLDAINLIERGDYNGAVRRVTTAIEVLVENLLEFELLKFKSQEEVALELNKKPLKNNFPFKLYKYLELSARLIPDWINPELDKIRNLRHTIVHKAQRISFNNKGLAQEKVDKGRWIYNWFEDKENRRNVREQKISYRSLGRDIGPIFQSKITADGVIILKPKFADN